MQRKTVVAISMTAAGFFLGLAVAFGYIPTTEEPKIQRALGLAITMAWFWLMKAEWHYCHFAFVALLPLLFFSVLPWGFVDTRSMTLGGYAQPLLGLFALSLLMGSIVEQNGGSILVKRLIARTGYGSRGVFILLLLCTAALSTFMPNTAAATIMFPATIAAAALFHDPRIEYPLRNGVAVAATLGGLATPIGTMPNGITQRALAQIGIDVSFVQWMMIGMPVTIVCLAIAIPLIIYRTGYPSLPAPRCIIEGSVPRGARVRLGVASFLFALLIAAWIFHFEGAKGEQPKFWGWVLGFFVIVVFPLPGGAILSLSRIVTKEFFWREGVLFVLMGGGMALGTVLQKAKADNFVAQLIVAGCRDWSPYGVFLSCGILFTLAGELLSNTAFASLVMPIVVTTAIALGVDPVVACIAMGMVCSHGSILITATPPLIVMADKLNDVGVRIYQATLRRTGVPLDLILAPVTVSMVWILAPLLLQ